MEIRIASYVAGSWLLEREPHVWDALIVLGAGFSSTPFAAAHARSVCYLHFDDIESPRTRQNMPTKAAVAEGLAFASGKEKLLVCCRASQGRSVALAYLIACQTHGIPAGLQLLDPTRHHPNRTVVALGDALLDSTAVLDAFDAWQRQHAHVNLEDYYDAMEQEYEALEAQGATNRICT